MGNCLFLRAQGWGIDRQMKTKLQIPGGMPGGAWLQVELNHALLVTSLRVTIAISARLLQQKQQKNESFF